MNFIIILSFVIVLVTIIVLISPREFLLRFGLRNKHDITTIPQKYVLTVYVVGTIVLFLSLFILFGEIESTVYEDPTSGLIDWIWG